MRKHIINMLLFTLALTGIAVASEDCMMVDFPDHVELICTGDGVRVPENEQKLLQNRFTAPPRAAQNNSQAPGTDKAATMTESATKPLKPEEMVLVPKTLQIRMDRAAQTMERMRQQKIQRNADPSVPRITPSP